MSVIFQNVVYLSDKLSVICQLSVRWLLTINWRPIKPLLANFLFNQKFWTVYNFETVRNCIRKFPGKVFRKPWNCWIFVKRIIPPRILSIVYYMERKFLLTDISENFGYISRSFLFYRNSGKCRSICQIKFRTTDMWGAKTMKLELTKIALKRHQNATKTQVVQKEKLEISRSFLICFPQTIIFTLYYAIVCNIPKIFKELLRSSKDR